MIATARHFSEIPLNFFQLAYTLAPLDISPPNLQGQIDVLVATDVAARGLDIANVDLVLQTSPPMDHDTYVHRSGRTGRAGKEGTN